MKVRENYSCRRFDCAFPKAAANEFGEMFIREIKAGVQIEMLRSGPMVIKYRAYPNVIHEILLIEEKHADRIIKQISEISAKHPIDPEEYHGFGD